MEHHFFAPQLEFRNELLAGNVIPLRPLFYAKPIHSHFALLAFFMTEDPEVTQFLSDYPWIEGLESVLFVLKRPHWAKGQKKRTDGDPRFWYAGGVVNWNLLFWSWFAQIIPLFSSMATQSCNCGRKTERFRAALDSTA